LYYINGPMVLLVIMNYYGYGYRQHEPINHGLPTPFLSYRVTLNARKTRDFIRDLIIWQSYKLLTQFCL